jgi:exosortase A
MPDPREATTVELPPTAIEASRAALHGRGVVPTVVLLFAWVLVLFLPTTLSMVSIWYRSDTFAHGFVVFPIFLYLLWRQRDELEAIETATCLPALLGMAGAGAVWLLGERVSAAVISQLAMVAMIPFAVWAVLGTRVTAALGIPLAFLFSAVPFGDFLVPRMMDWTADFTVSAIKLSGVPIYREGNYFQIPTGRWSVVEACSGFRYLIASFMIGCLYAYLTYRSPLRRAAFAVVSLIVPIFANWLRAYMTVMIGHIFGNNVADGVAHLVYGWVFFGVVMALLFWIGSRWREDDVPIKASDVTPPSRPQPSPLPARRWPVLLAVIVLSAMWPLLQASLAQVPRGEKLELGRVGDGNGWVDAPGKNSAWRPDLSGATSELTQTFVKGESAVTLHVALYRDQTREAKAITSTNQLVREGNDVWKQVGADSISTVIDGQQFSARTAVIAGSRQRFAVWQWFWVNGHETSSEFLAKLYQAISVLRGHGDAVAWVIVYTPTEIGTPKASAALQQFTGDMRGAIDAALRKAVAQ